MQAWDKTVAFCCNTVSIMPHTGQVFQAWNSFFQGLIYLFSRPEIPFFRPEFPKFRAWNWFFYMNPNFKNLKSGQAWKVHCMRLDLFTNAYKRKKKKMKKKTQNKTLNLIVKTSLCDPVYIDDKPWHFIMSVLSLQALHLPYLRKK